MADFAKIDEYGKVVQVAIVPKDQSHRGADFLSLDLNLIGEWIEINNDNCYKGKCSPGFVWDNVEKIFIPPKPAPWFIFDKNKKKWECPSGIDEVSGEHIEAHSQEFDYILNGIPKYIVYKEIM